MAVLPQCLSGVPSNVANILLRVFVPLKGGFLVELLVWLVSCFLRFLMLHIVVSGRFLVCLERKAVVFMKVCVCL